MKNTSILAIVCALAGGILYAFNNLVPVTLDSLLMPFWTFFIQGFAMSGVLAFFWLQLYTELETTKVQRFTWYIIMMLIPVATEFIVSLLKNAIGEL